MDKSRPYRIKSLEERKNKGNGPLKICKNCNTLKPHKAFDLCESCYQMRRWNKKIEKEIQLGIREKNNGRKLTNEILLRYHQKHNYSTEKIARLLGISKSTVVDRLKKLGITLKLHRFKKNHKQRVTHGFNLFLKTYKKLHPLCEYCNWKYGVDTHHIIKLSKGGTHTEDNVICLCPNHHRLADKGLLKIKKKDSQIFLVDLTIEKTERRID